MTDENQETGKEYLEAGLCQMFDPRHRPDAAHILNFPHRGEHMNNLLEALEKAKAPTLELSKHKIGHIGRC